MTATTAKKTTPGYKSILISQATFDALQRVQKNCGIPMRLSVADLADAAIDLQLQQGNRPVIEKAKQIAIHSLQNRN